MRVVHGVPVSWDPNAAATRTRFTVIGAVWSPCNRFIAIRAVLGVRVDILDSATLQRLQSFEFLRETALRSHTFAFSPDSRILTAFLSGGHPPDAVAFVVTWDLQTGGVVSAIEWKGPGDDFVRNAQITYSADGKMVAALSRRETFTIISIYDIASGVSTHDVLNRACTDLDVTLGFPYVYKIWTHGQSLRFATPGPMAITIWEVGFTPGSIPTEVERVSIPNNTVEMFVFKPREQSDITSTEFHPASCRLAFIDPDQTLLIWDARASKFLPHYTDACFFEWMSFSPDGRLFMCTTTEPEIYLWQESPAGYMLSGKLTPGIHHRFSPNCESMITFGGSTVRLWPTKRLTTSNLLTRPRQSASNFLLEFSPDRPLAVAARKEGKTITLLDLNSGVPLLVIDTSIEVYGLRLIENTIVVMGSEKVIVWGLPGGDFLPKSRMKIEDSTRTISFRDVDDSVVFAASVSADLKYIALAGYNEEEEFLDVYCTSTEQKIHGDARAFELWFAPGGHDIWCAIDNKAEVLTITPDGLDCTNTVVDIEDGSLESPWGSSRGYNVTGDGWVLGGGDKRLLMLSPLWQSQFKVYRVWNGKFLALLHGELPEPVILELEP